MNVAWCLNKSLCYLKVQVHRGWWLWLACHMRYKHSQVHRGSGSGWLAMWCKIPCALHPNARIHQCLSSRKQQHGSDVRFYYSMLTELKACARWACLPESSEPHAIGIPVYAWGFPRQNGPLKEHQLLNPRSCRLSDAFHFRVHNSCNEPEACFQPRSRAEAQGLTELKASVAVL